MEAALGQRLQVPTEVGQQHRVASKRHRDARAELETLCMACRDRDWQEWIVAGFRRPHGVVPGLFLCAGLCGDLLDVGRLP